jgi:hypothetical protein
LKGGILAKAKFYTGTQAKIDAKAIENGAIYAATDKNVLAVDVNNKRVSLDADAISTNSSDISSLKETVANKSDSDHTHSLADLSGVAAAALKLSSSDGTGLNISQPVYFKNGIPTPTWTINVENSGKSKYTSYLTDPSWSSLDPGEVTYVSKGSENNPVYFKDGVPEACDNTLSVDITGNAATADTASGALKITNSSGTGLTVGNEGYSPVYFKNGVPTAMYYVKVDNSGKATYSSYLTDPSWSSWDPGDITYTTKGSETVPVYFKDGRPVECNEMASSDIIVVSSTEPTSSACKVWFQTS